MLTCSMGEEGGGGGGGTELHVVTDKWSAHTGSFLVCNYKIITVCEAKIRKLMESV